MSSDIVNGCGEMMIINPPFFLKTASYSKINDEGSTNRLMFDLPYYYSFISILPSLAVGKARLASKFEPSK